MAVCLSGQCFEVWTSQQFCWLGRQPAACNSTGLGESMQASSAAQHWAKQYSQQLVCKSAPALCQSSSVPVSFGPLCVSGPRIFCKTQPVHQPLYGTVPCVGHNRHNTKHTAPTRAAPPAVETRASQTECPFLSGWQTPTARALTATPAKSVTQNSTHEISSVRMQRRGGQPR